MDIDTKKYKQQGILFCETLINKLQKNKEDATLFFGGDIKKEYVYVTEKAINKTKKILADIKKF